MLGRTLKCIWVALVFLAIWMTFESWISSEAFCYQAKEYGGAYQTAEKYYCFFQGPIASTARAFAGWWARIFTDANDYIALLTAVLAVSTIALWISTHALFKVSKVAADAARLNANAAIVSLSPIIRIGSVKFENRNAWFADDGSVVAGNEQSVSVVPRVINNGSGAATVTGVNTDFAIGKTLPKDPMPRRTWILKDGLFIAASGRLDLKERPSISDVTPEHKRRIAADELKFWYYGIVRVRDFFDNETELGFIWRYTNPSEGFTEAFDTNFTYYKKYSKS